MTTKINQKVDISDGITVLPRLFEGTSAPSEKHVEGILYVNSDGRYAIDEYHVLRCGSSVQLYVCGKWLKTSIEADSNGRYYAVGLKGLPLAGVTARVRK